MTPLNVFTPRTCLHEPAIKNEFWVCLRQKCFFSFFQEFSKNVFKMEKKKHSCPFKSEKTRFQTTFLGVGRCEPSYSLLLKQHVLALSKQLRFETRRFLERIFFLIQNIRTKKHVLQRPVRSPFLHNEKNCFKKLVWKRCFINR